jgi:hypothetical protein
MIRVDALMQQIPNATKTNMTRIESMAKTDAATSVAEHLQEKYQ